MTSRKAVSGEMRTLPSFVILTSRCQTRLLLRKSMRLLRDKQIQRAQRKHGLIPI